MPEFQFPRFPLGQTVTTPGALATFAELFGEDRALIKMCDLLHRHCCGDWGEMDEHDLHANEQALVDGTRVFSGYSLGNLVADVRRGERVWIITEADRSYTTVLLPEEY